MASGERRARLQAERTELQERIAQLEQQVAWFQRQLFGKMSERRHLDPPTDADESWGGPRPCPGPATSKPCGGRPPAPGGRRDRGQPPVEFKIEKADKAIVAEDFHVRVDIYTDDAVFVIEPDRNAVGKNDTRKAFSVTGVYFKNGLQVQQNGMGILESGDTALMPATAVVSGPGFPATERMATYVFSTSPGGIWLRPIDNSYGHDIIGKNA